MPRQSDDSLYFGLTFSVGIWPYLSISVCFGINATIFISEEIQCLPYAGFNKNLNYVILFGAKSCKEFFAHFLLQRDQELVCISDFLYVSVTPLCDAV